jgi:hypothetical protein
MSSPPSNVTSPSPSDGAALVWENEKLLNEFLKSEQRRQMFSPRAQGGLTVFVFTGSTTVIQGQLTYNTTFQPMASGQGYDFLTDINIWSRGTVSTAGVVTGNSTSIIIRSTGSAPITLAPGESFTLRNKNPTMLEFAAGAATTGTDSVIIFW